MPPPPTAPPPPTLGYDLTYPETYLSLEPTVVGAAALLKSHGVELDDLQVGDVIGIHSSGAYGVSASPTNFISHDPPREIFVETRDGNVVVTEADTAAAER